MELRCLLSLNVICDQVDMASTIKEPHNGSSVSPALLCIQDHGSWLSGLRSFFCRSPSDSQVQSRDVLVAGSTPISLTQRGWTFHDRTVASLSAFLSHLTLRPVGSTASSGSRQAPTVRLAWSFDLSLLIVIVFLANRHPLWELSSLQ